MTTLRSTAPSFVKQIVWNAKHLTTHTDPSRFPSRFLGLVMNFLSSTDRILDLGCGSGNFLAALRQEGWAGHYTGVDVSDVAIDRARLMNDQNADWHIGTIEKFPVTGVRVHLISFIESLYYARLMAVPEMLDRCIKCLDKDGRVYIRIADTRSHRAYIEMLQSFSRARCIRESPETLVLTP